MLRFGPPRSFTCASTCPWIGHPVSGLFIATGRTIHARFHYASDNCLKLATTNNSLDRSTKSTPSGLITGDEAQLTISYKQIAMHYRLAISHVAT